MMRLMIRITDQISIDESELEESFIRASGPGGQHVNKTETAVQLRFNVRQSRSGVIVITAQNERSQKRNRDEALQRLVELIRQAAVKPVKRRATKPTKASKEKRLESKKRRSGIKGLRQNKPRAE